ncbi:MULTISPECIES: glycoside hydrolase family 43 protein [unclassified Leeuwenhoekiella]|uniref:glycoside hydrolase family 43 protein n=1 Tax=unclassified Leeuwenhoekiella TaxID=2615029 RepID=UPI000C5B948C|nr:MULTISPECIES: glycoside hydrolase family 43 protein [unclassified Leeuwenhoekiella]MAW95444.1 glycosyl hydrolase family 43 [Leeuwenhoekiella sp.]MBA80831.1 glycosyl hydrolase family 43 [Leeuwenhoekiella sp.]|tara:strand:+ start:25837 stop:26862 length:1026 start_codon:yes stop_codon:yes gene_type:complete
MKILITVLITCLLSLFSNAQSFKNPVLDSGADPYSIFVDGYYYYTHTVGDRVVLYKTKNLANLRNAQSKTIWMPPKGTAYSHNIWAPEIHYIDNVWYVYFAADDGDNDNHRMYAIRNATKDPFSEDWEFKGKLAAQPDRWAIDGNVFKYNNQLYMVWSGWEGEINGQQNIYISKMSNPWTLEGNRVLIAQPTYNWEKQGDLNDAKNPPHVNVNEGPQFLEHNGKVFIVFSASGCWTDYYALGLIEFSGGELLNPVAWEKKAKPIFMQSAENAVYAPGHNSFFKSPNGTEDWILYHANANPGDGCEGKRSPRMQKINWNDDSTPNLGVPVSTETLLSIPLEQ